MLQRSNMILKLLANKGVLSPAEYQAALAETPNVGRLQKKVDESIKKVEVMANLSSAHQEAPSVPAGQEPSQQGTQEPGVPAANPPGEAGTPKEAPAAGSPRPAEVNPGAPESKP